MNLLDLARDGAGYRPTRCMIQDTQAELTCCACDEILNEFGQVFDDYGLVALDQRVTQVLQPLGKQVEPYITIYGRGQRQLTLSLLEGFKN